jgi:hypothetical protein
MAIRAKRREAEKLLYAAARPVAFISPLLIALDRPLRADSTTNLAPLAGLSVDGAPQRVPS